MSYAILITGETTQAGTHKQILIANHNNKNYAWTRKTNGGRGESNAWFDNDYVDVIATATSTHIVGEVLSSPLTAVDVKAIESGERPTVLIQKLTKQFGLRHSNTDTTRTIADVLDEARFIDIKSVMGYIVSFTNAIYTSRRYSIFRSPICFVVFFTHSYKCISCKFKFFTIHSNKVIYDTCPSVL